jgi:hypothetical protein
LSSTSGGEREKWLETKRSSAVHTIFESAPFRAILTVGGGFWNPPNYLPVYTLKIEVPELY